MPYQVLNDQGKLVPLTADLILALLAQARAPVLKVVTTQGMIDLPGATPLAPLARSGNWHDLQGVPPAIQAMASLTPGATPLRANDAPEVPRATPPAGPRLPGLQPPARACCTTPLQVLQGTLTIDSTEMLSGDVVLLTGQPLARQNGPWVVQAQAWVRPTWWTDPRRGDWFQILLGTREGGSIWSVETPGTPRVDQDPVIFVRAA